MANSAEVAMFKNKLQEYTQKRRLAMPAYRAANEGSSHAPKFRATVFVDGAEYTSKSTFRRLREAEQDAAKLAYDCILSNSKQNDFIKRVPEKEPRCSKSILHDVTFKKHSVIPKYSTVLEEAEGGLPVYVSSVTVKDNTFTGAGARSKREAEQIAARTALHSLHGTDSSVILNQMMSSKRKHYSVPIQPNTSEFNQKKLRNMAAEGPGAASQVKNIVVPFKASAPNSFPPVARSAFRRRSDAQGVRFGIGNAAQGGAKMVNRKLQQPGRFA